VYRRRRARPTVFSFAVYGPADHTFVIGLYRRTGLFVDERRRALIDANNYQTPKRRTVFRPNSGVGGGWYYYYYEF